MLSKSSTHEGVADASFSPDLPTIRVAAKAPKALTHVSEDPQGRVPGGTRRRGESGRGSVGSTTRTPGQDHRRRWRNAHGKKGRRAPGRPLPKHQGTALLRGVPAGGWGRFCAFSTAAHRGAEVLVGTDNRNAPPRASTVMCRMAHIDRLGQRMQRLGTYRLPADGPSRITMYDKPGTPARR